MKTISKEQWDAIQQLARSTRDLVDKFNKPSNKIHSIYSRSLLRAHELGYGGDEDEWRHLCRTIVG